MKKQTRAISAEQKQARRDHILLTARALLLTQGYAACQMDDVAAAAGLAKGTLYLYFKTKEEVFLAVLQDAFLAWFADLDQRLESGTTPLTVNQLVLLLSDLLDSHPVWVRLVPISHTILERNIMYSAALEFKQMLARGLYRSGLLLEKRFPGIKAGSGAAHLMEIYAMLIGVQNLADPAPLVKEIIKQEPTLAAFEIKRSEMFSSMLTIYLTGLNTQS